MPPSWHPAPQREARAGCDGEGIAPGSGAKALNTSVPAGQAAASRLVAEAVPATSLEPRSSLIYLTNFKSADGFTLGGSD